MFGERSPLIDSDNFDSLREKRTPATLARSPLGSLTSAASQAGSQLAGAAAQAGSSAASSAAQAGAAAVGSALGGGGHAAAGGSGDTAHDELLRRLRDEQEQLGTLIQHPF